MKNPHRFNFPLICIGILLITIIAGAQQLEKSVARLKLEHNRLISIIDNPTTAQEIRELNKQLLVKNEALMKDAIFRSIDALEAYAKENADMLDNDDRRDISERIEAYRYDLAQIKGASKLPPPSQLFGNTVALNTANDRLVKPVDLIDDRPLPSANLFSKISSVVTQPPSVVVGSFSGSVPVAAKPGAVLNQFTLTINFVGNSGGTGKVTDDQLDRIVCEKSCTHDYQAGTAITLKSHPDAGSTFVSWAGACTVNPCTILMDQARTVTITFNGTPAPPVPAAAASAAANKSNDEPYDWGRVHGYFTSGIVLSKDRDITSTERNNFSKPDIYLDFTLDSNWLPNKKGNKFLGIFDNVNTFFSARMTSVPVTNTTQPAASASPSPSPSPSPAPATTCKSAECATFLTSEKAAKLEAGVYFPIELGGWYFDGTKSNHALFVAPIFKGGIQTITGDRTSVTAEARRFGGDDIYNFFSFGAMFGHYKKAKDENSAPELINWLQITRGRFENFEYLNTDGPKDSSGNFLHRVRPWRYEATGMLKVPRTPFVLGFNGNFGKGPDDLRFLFGMRFDIAKVLDKLGSGSGKTP